MSKKKSVKKNSSRSETPAPATPDAGSNGRPKEQELPAMKGPGVEKITNKEIEAAADAYVETRDRRQKLSIDEKALKTKLLGAMHAANLTLYDYDGKIVTVSPKDETETVRVKVKDKDETDVEVE